MPRVSHQLPQSVPTLDRIGKARFLGWATHCTEIVDVLPSRRVSIPLPSTLRDIKTRLSRPLFQSFLPGICFLLNPASLQAPTASNLNRISSDRSRAVPGLRFPDILGRRADQQRRPFNNQPSQVSGHPFRRDSTLTLTLDQTIPPPTPHHPAFHFMCIPLTSALLPSTKPGKMTQ